MTAPTADEWLEFLIDSARYGDTEDVKQALQEGQVPVDATDSGGRTGAMRGFRARCTRRAAASRRGLFATWSTRPRMHACGRHLTPQHPPGTRRTRAAVGAETHSPLPHRRPPSRAPGSAAHGGGERPRGHSVHPAGRTRGGWAGARGERGAGRGPQCAAGHTWRSGAPTSGRARGARGSTYRRRGRRALPGQAQVPMSARHQRLRQPAAAAAAAPCPPPKQKPTPRRPVPQRPRACRTPTAGTPRAARRCIGRASTGGARWCGC